MAKSRKRKRKEKTAKATPNLLHLPSDVLLQILIRLDHSDRLALSLVSNSFRSLADGFVRKLNFKRVPSKSELRKFLSRFTSVTRIVFQFSDRIGRALIAISKSQCKIEALEICGNFTYPKPHHMIKLAGRLGMVKMLKLDWFVDLVDLQVVEFIHLFLSLEELDLSGCVVWSDLGIEKLASDVPNLRKINLNDNKYLTDKSLDVLANCVNLDHISFEGCGQITLQGFCAFVCKRKNLKSLEVPTYFQSDILTLAETISCCENLSHLSINRDFIRDDILSVIANTRSPLTSLDFKSYTYTSIGYTMIGLSTMLRAFQGLSRLHIYLPQPRSDTQDMEMSQLVKFLPCLKDIFLVSSTPAYATLFSLIHNCPLLECICMHFDRHIRYNMPELMITKNYSFQHFVRHTRYDMPELITKNYSIQRIDLLPKPGSSLKTTLKSLCPSLKSLN